ncbi:MAG: substrate-binding domain-containing protein [Ktedonobacterales bacterium]
MRGWRIGLIVFPLILTFSAGCGTTSVSTIDANQLGACQVTASDLMLPAQPASAFPTTAGLSGQTLTMDGSTALFPLFQAAAPAFDQANGTKTSVGQGGSITGLENVEAGKVQIGMSDVFYQDNANTKGYTDLVDHRVAVVAFTLAVSKDLQATVHNLTTRQIQAIFDGTVNNWAQLGGPNEEITLIERPTTSGTRATLEEYVLTRLPQGAAKVKQLTTDSSGLVAQAIAATPGSIGYLATGYVTNPSYSSSIFPVCINGHPPTEASINAGTYLFWNYEHAYTKGPPSPAAQAFLTSITSPAVQASLVPAKGFLRIDQLTKAAQATHPLPPGAA